MEVDSESKRASDNLNRSKRKRKRRIKICIWTTVVLLALGLIVLILALTVFKAKRPDIAVDAISVSNLSLSADVFRLSVSLNLTIDADVTVKNPNRVGFRYEDSTCVLRYGGIDVGQVPIPAGSIGAGDTRALNLTLTLMADRLLTNSEFYSDVSSGTIPLQTYVRISGKVRILFNFHVVAYSTCDLEIDLSTCKVANQTCHYKTKL